ncbi:hypothetical protein CPB83DRAFT_893588 [Crepidotus variabilis]|uniref:Uncharacterized protein n=1 Tax=Crepidotus variabilis TaxID=179855 RepID=A0A9P6EIC2_9AGAR|nr:hypothetical protein CPB83DRAFT_893588 [Crepidotus variabilis]
MTHPINPPSQAQPTSSTSKPSSSSTSTSTLVLPNTNSYFHKAKANDEDDSTNSWDEVQSSSSSSSDEDDNMETLNESIRTRRTRILRSITQTRGCVFRMFQSNSDSESDEDSDTAGYGGDEADDGKHGVVSGEIDVQKTRTTVNNVERSAPRVSALFTSIRPIPTFRSSNPLNSHAYLRSSLCAPLYKSKYQHYRVPLQTHPYASESHPSYLPHFLPVAKRKSSTPTSMSMSISVVRPGCSVLNALSTCALLFPTFGYATLDLKHTSSPIFIKFNHYALPYVHPHTITNRSSVLSNSSPYFHKAKDDVDDDSTNSWDEVQSSSSSSNNNNIEALDESTRTRRYLFSIVSTAPPAST